MKKLNLGDKNKICELYKTTSIGEIAKMFNIGDRRVRKILVDNGIVIRNNHEKKISNDSYIEDKASRYPSKDGYKYIAVSKIDGSVFEDYLNKSGSLSRHIKTSLSIEIPSLFKRKKFFKENGIEWHEQWFEIKQIPIGEHKQCPYCNWSTADINNRSGMFGQHLIKEHDISIEEHLKNHPEDIEFFSKQKKVIDKAEKLTHKENYVVCPICGQKFEKITHSHINNMHNMSYFEFKEKYPEAQILSNNQLEIAQILQKSVNLHVSKNRFISKYEKEINGFLKDNGLQTECNRQILIGKEIDILVPDKKIGIECDGLKWHTEWFGKKPHNYHLNKTLECNKKGYGLIHIFEDEFVNKKDIVFNKLRHIFHIPTKKINAYGRMCVIKEIYKYEAENFLEKYHIQGFSSASVYLGAYLGCVLVGVMLFKNGNIKNADWELTRFATHQDYNCVGVAGKLFKYFIKNYKPIKIYSFADRRWTINVQNNLYTKLGFSLDKLTAPDYTYYNERIDRYTRIHKMRFSKKALIKKYGFPETMTETEMAKELGYDRIWNCGLAKYVWTAKDNA